MSTIPIICYAVAEDAARHRFSVARVDPDLVCTACGSPDIDLDEAAVVAQAVLKMASEPWAGDGSDGKPYVCPTCGKWRNAQNCPHCDEQKTLDNLNEKRRGPSLLDYIFEGIFPSGAMATKTAAPEWWDRLRGKDEDAKETPPWLGDAYTDWDLDEDGTLTLIPPPAKAAKATDHVHDWQHHEDGEWTPENGYAGDEWWECSICHATKPTGSRRTAEIDPESLTNDDVVMLARYMADNGYGADEVAYMVEKPWKFVDVLEEARKTGSRRTAANLGTPEKCAFCDKAPTVWSQFLDSTGTRVLSTNYYCDDHEGSRFNWGGQQMEGGSMSHPPKTSGRRTADFNDPEMAEVGDTSSVSQRVQCSTCLTDHVVTAADPAQPMPACPNCGALTLSPAGGTLTGTSSRRTAGKPLFTALDAMAAFGRQGEGGAPYSGAFLTAFYKEAFGMDFPNSYDTSDPHYQRGLSDGKEAGAQWFRDGSVNGYVISRRTTAETFYNDDVSDFDTTVVDGVKVHTFDSTGQAYNWSQSSDGIGDGDVLAVPSEGVYGFLQQAWPIAVVIGPGGSGEFHTLLDGWTYDMLPGGPYTKSVEVARKVAGQRGASLTDDIKKQFDAENPSTTEGCDICGDSGHTTAQHKADPAKYDDATRTSRRRSPRVAAKIREIADGVLATNPGMNREAALDIAARTVRSYPAVLSEGN